MNYLEKLDIFYSTDFKFSVFKKPSFKTPLGGVLSIMTLALSVVVSFYFGQDLFYGTNPKVYYNQVITETYPSFNLTKDNFLIYYQIQDGYGIPLQTKPNLYFHTYYQQAKVNGVGNPVFYNSTYINSTPCDMNQVGNSNYFKSKNMSQFNCLNLTNPDSEKTGYEIGGYWDGDFVNYFYMELSFCQNVTDDYKGINCTDTNQITDYLYQGGNLSFMNIFVPTGYLVENSLTQPLKTDYSSYFYKLALKTYGAATFFFEKKNLQDDRGILFSKTENSSKISLSKESSIYSQIEGTNATENFYSSVLFSAVIYLTKNSADYRRSFMKIQDLAAQVGGFINGIFIICRIIIIFFNSVETKKIIINNIFDVNKKSPNNNNKLKSEIKDQTTPKIIKKEESSSINILEIAMIEPSQQIIENKKILLKSLSMKIREKDLEVRNEEFEISYISLLKNACCKKCLNDENLKTLSQLSYAEEYIEKKLDIEYYLQLLIKFDYLVKILLTKEERLLFNFTKKPPLKVKKSDVITKLLDKEKKRELVEFYNNNKNDQRNKNIINLLDSNVLEYISKKQNKINKNDDQQIK